MGRVFSFEEKSVPSPATSFEWIPSLIDAEQQRSLVYQILTGISEAKTSIEQRFINEDAISRQVKDLPYSVCGR